jgi:hypothetical protein
LLAKPPPLATARSGRKTKTAKKEAPSWSHRRLEIRGVGLEEEGEETRLFLFLDPNRLHNFHRGAVWEGIMLGASPSGTVQREEVEEDLGNILTDEADAFCIIILGANATDLSNKKPRKRRFNVFMILEHN